MVRTRESAGIKVGGKSSKASSVSASNSNTSKFSDSNKPQNSLGGGNPYCPRETPKWQKPITTFFNNPAPKEKHNDTSSKPGTSSGASSSSDTNKENVDNNE